MSARAWAFQRGILYAMDFAGAAPAPLAPRVAARFAEVGRESAGPLARAMDLHGVFEVIERFETDRRCFAGWRDDEIVTYGWLSQRDEAVGELERVYQLQAGDAYIWDCATPAPYRGQGLYAALLSYTSLTLRGEGVRRAWIGSNLENRPSLRGFERVGFLPVMQVAYVRLLGICCLWMLAQPAAQRELVAGARRMLIAPHERAWRSWAVGIRRAASASHADGA